MRMVKERALIINNDYRFDLPASEVITESFPSIELTYNNTLKDSIEEIETGVFKVIVMKYPDNPIDKALLNKMMHYLIPNPAIVIIDDHPLKISDESDEFDNACIFITDNPDLKISFISALSTAFKYYRLNYELYSMHKHLSELKYNQNIVDLTLSHNNKINNLLTVIIGNIHMIMNSSQENDSGTLNKLDLIDKDTQKIQDMALNLVNITNAPVKSLNTDF